MRCAVIVSLCAITPLAAQSTRDSAGIRIVTDARATNALPLWHVVAKPVLDLGGSDAAEATTFFNIMGAQRLSDGTIAVANMGTNQLRLFSSTGTFLRSVGRKGGGPGEFQQVMALTSYRDTLVVSDASGGPRVFAPNGKFVRQIPAVTGDPRGQFLFRGVLGDGSLLYAVNGPSKPGSPVYMATWLRSGADGKNFRDFITAPSRENGTAESVLDARWSWALFPDRFCHGYSTRFDITCHNGAGAPTLIIRRTIAAVPVSDSMRKAYEFGATHPFSAEHPGPPTAEDIARLKQEAAKFVYPKVMPMFGPFIAGRSGELWVSSFQSQVDWPNGQWRPSPPDQTAWVVLGADGRLLARIVLPARFVLTDAGADYLLGIRRDEEDVEHVTMYCFQRNERNN